MKVYKETNEKCKITFEDLNVLPLDVKTPDFLGEVKGLLHQVYGPLLKSKAIGPFEDSHSNKRGSLDVEVKRSAGQHLINQSNKSCSSISPRNDPFESPKRLVSEDYSDDSEIEEVLDLFCYKYNIVDLLMIFVFRKFQ
jgi:hypothetical protein